ncbi:F-box/LRR-repeat protein 21-like [Physella acuta]|uniref:F-box/LRR-repeat protein 21-like n=1 Tax=Physella acuta TaxID=109671 RepID=UPI0027DDD932|nr:F-box/LRR-repeat protein 21-like [Physella acuta]
MSVSTDKRLKRVTVDLVDCEGDVAKRDPKCADQSLAESFDWSQLPYEIVLNVFLYLIDNSDKYHAALTCKSWLRPLSEPSLWQSGNFVFNSQSDQKAIKFVKKIGKYLRHIQADCPVQKDGASSIDELYEFLAHLNNARNKQLLTFKLTNFVHVLPRVAGQLRRYPSDVVKLLRKLLGAQLQLRVLELSNCQVAFYKAVKLLTAASQNCANTLHTLAIDRIGSYSNDDTDIPSTLVPVICCFRNLADLELSYEYLCDDLLLKLATKTTSLKVLTIRAENDSMEEEEEVGTTAPAWKKLTKACPELRTVVFIKQTYECYFDQTTTTVLQPSMPLYEVHWNAGRLIAIESIELFFQHVARHFQKSMHNLELQTGTGLDMECFEVLFKSLQPCKNLDTLSLGLTCETSDDVEKYNLTIRDVMALYPVSCDVTLNGEKVN